MVTDPFPNVDTFFSRLLKSLHRVVSVWGTAVIEAVTPLGDISLFAFQMFASTTEQLCRSPASRALGTDGIGNS